MPTSMVFKCPARGSPSEGKHPRFMAIPPPSLNCSTTRIRHDYQPMSWPEGNGHTCESTRLRFASRFLSDRAAITIFCHLLILLTTVGSLMAATTFTYKGPGTDKIHYDVSWLDDRLQVSLTGPDVEIGTLFLALGSDGETGSRLVPFGRGKGGSTVFLPFAARAILVITANEATLWPWDRTKWGEMKPAKNLVETTRDAGRISVSLSPSLIGDARKLNLVAYLKDMTAAGGWGKLFGNLDPHGPVGEGDIVLRSYLTGAGSLTSVTAPDKPKVRIYQFLPRHFGNTNETRKVNGFLEDNGSGKFSDINEKSLAELKKMGFTHLWPTGVIQQATATDYSAVGEPADDPDLLKGLAGSPYAIKDYFDVSPDYANDPAKRLEEFREMVERVHAAGMKVLIDFVPNHVARSYGSTVRPELSFGAEDDRTRYFHPNNNFFWLTPEVKPFGKGPPLRLPTVDADGKPTSPTAKVAKAASDGLFEPEREHGRVTGSNLASWEPDMGSWYETVKLNYGYDFLDPSKQTRSYPHGDRQDLPVPNTWEKMDAIIAYWQELGVDGFRVDMAHLVPPEFWKWMIARARGRDADVYFVAEAYDTDPAKVPSGDSLVAEVGGGNVMFDLLNSGFDAVYDDATYDKLKEIYEAAAWANDLDRIAARPFVFDQSLRYAENHDEVRLAAKLVWGEHGAAVGRPVSALLFGLSRGPVMLYSGQEVGEPADGAEGFGEDDARTSIFDYWSMPEFVKWVNGGAFDGGKLSPEQKSLREFYSRLLNLLAEPAFRNGDFIPLNPLNMENPAYGRLAGEEASGHWIYGFLRHDPVSGQSFLVVINLHPTKSLNDVKVKLPKEWSPFEVNQNLVLREQLADRREVSVKAGDLASAGISLGNLSPLTPYYFQFPSIP